MKEKMHMKRLLSVILTVCMLVTLIGMVPMNCNAALADDNITFMASMSDQQILPDGIYYVKNKQSDKVMDIKDSSVKSGESIHQFDFDGTYDQLWQFAYQGNGYYTIKSLHSNLYLSVKNNNSRNGEEIVQYEYSGKDGQLWSITKTTSGAYKLTAKLNTDKDLCLMKGTYIFYPNKLVHMVYTDNNSYDDEWYITSKYDSTLIAIQSVGHDHDSSFPKVLGYLKDMGFTINRNSLVADESSFVSSIRNSKIFYIRTHGNKDLVELTYEYIGVSKLNSLSSDTFSECRLVLYGSCSCGEGRDGANNMVNATAAKGVQTVIGFDCDVYCEEMNIWGIGFFEALKKVIMYKMHVCEQRQK